MRQLYYLAVTQSATFAEESSIIILNYVSVECIVCVCARTRKLPFEPFKGL